MKETTLSENSSLLTIGGPPMRKVIVTQLGLQVSQLGIAAENASYAYEPVSHVRFTLNGKRARQLKICFVPGPGTYDQLFWIRIISLFNTLSNARVSIFFSDALIAELSPFCNEHITLINVNDAHKAAVETDIVFTFGSGVVDLLQRKLPVFVLGPHGIGGLVTEENFYFLLNAGFMGRAGGTYGEELPAPVVAHELGIFCDNEDLDEFLEKNFQLATALPFQSVEKEMALQAQIREELLDAFADPKRKWQMRPVLCSNIEIQSDVRHAYIKRRHINDTLCSLDKDDVHFFEAMRGHKTNAELQRESGMDEEEYLEILTGLLEKEIINLSL